MAAIWHLDDVKPLDIYKLPRKTLKELAERLKVSEWNIGEQKFERWLYDDEDLSEIPIP